MRIGMCTKSVLATIVCGCALVVSSSAQAAEPSGLYAPFKGCPYTDSAVESCLLSVASGGVFTLGKVEVQVTPETPVALQGGFAYLDSGESPWTMAGAGFPTLIPTRFTVPGGIIGILNEGKSMGPLGDRFLNPGEKDVHATAELAGPILFGYGAFSQSRDDPAFVLPIKVHIENTFLGPDCYLGTDENPITLRLTVGTTHPPAGTPSLTGYGGALTSSPDGTVLTSADNKLVDNTFSVPTATGCGNLPLDKLVLPGIVNSKVGLPASPGQSEAIFNGTAMLAERAQVQASVK